MNETSKTLAIWSEFEQSFIQGKGIDIGCGADPIKSDAMAFDIMQGDANCITRHVKEQFDFVFSSHCLEHMHDPYASLKEWWHLVKPGGHLIFIVPDEDLYEQGFFPSRFNPDHKTTFTISKRKSWSPVSINILELIQALPDSTLVSVELQDHHYDRSLQKHGQCKLERLAKLISKASIWWTQQTKMDTSFLQHLVRAYRIIDQTQENQALAQIQCILRKNIASTLTDNAHQVTT